MRELHFQTITELSAALEADQLTAVDLLEAVIQQTERVEGQVQAFLDYDVEDARAQALASDQRRAEGAALGPLDGIPIAIKDALAVAGQRLSCASKMLEHYVSPYDATCVAKLRAAGAVIWGRLNMDEFAMGSSTENSAFQTTCNPWNVDCIPGGSSGGSAAAVAAGQTIVSLGSDTGGSIRQPAALCGVVGLKPTYGMVSRYGLVAFASSLDQVGPFARSVEDAAIVLQAMLGKDPQDSTSLAPPVAVDYRAAIREQKGPWRIGVPKEFFAEGLDPEVKQSILDAIEWYRSQGCEIVDLSLPHSDLAVPVYYTVATAEASSNLARYDGVRYTHRSSAASDIDSVYFKSRGEAFGSEVKRRIMLGTYVLSSGYYDAYYLRAQKVRRLILGDFVEAFRKVDVILTPTSPTPAFKRGERSQDPLAMYLSDIYTISANLAGLPALSIPSGLTQSGLPIGLQLIGPAFAEANLLAVAHAFEQAHDYHLQAPTL
jgi:aspartyl-tRNA(Asn)/glutamyl-tRNA(Gln) amidotransferase subunit A